MILYFSGTGNSKLVAELLQNDLQEEVLSINEILKNKKEMVFTSKTPFIIVAPIYAWRLPRVIEEFIKKAEFKGNKKIYVVGTMGSQSGKTDSYCKKLIENRSYEFMGFCGVSMPDNYVVYDVMPTKKEAIKKIKKSIPSIHKIAKSIKEGRKIERDDKKSLDHIKSGFVNWSFYKFMVSSKKFTVADTCIGCGKCEKTCPMNNIKLVNGKPEFGTSCTWCMGCIQTCPKQAINYKKNTIDHGRYTCPSLNELK